MKELQTVRNKWAHLSSESIPANEAYRDADTLLRLLVMLGAPGSVTDPVQSEMVALVESMAAKSIGEGATPSGHVPDTEVNMNLGQEEMSLKRKFQVGDVVALRSSMDQEMAVIAINDAGPEPEYIVFGNGSRASFYESQLALSSPKDTQNVQSLTAREFQAVLTGVQIRSSSTSTLLSMRAGRVHYVPYQYRPVLKLIRADRPRLLIADEVGVGKTIEAGLIIKELRARMDISSILIICPKALVAEKKWEVEMKRFSEEFSALDGNALRFCIRETDIDGEWPDKYSKSILPFSLFDEKLVQGTTNGKRSTSLLKLDPPPRFDLVIVDEAHNIRNVDTWLHQGVRYFCDNAEAVLLLTATPVQLGSRDLFTLLNVLRPDLVRDHASFEQMAAPNPFIGLAVKACRSAELGWQSEALACLDEASQTPWGQLFLRGSAEFQTVRDLLSEPSMPDVARVSLIRQIEEMFTFSHLINRTRRRDIGTFTTRKAETKEAPFTESQRELHDRLVDIVALILQRFHGQQNVKFMMTTLRRQAASCLYGLAPLLEEMLNGKLDKLEYLESSDVDGDVDADFSFVGQIRNEVTALVNLAKNLDGVDPKATEFIQVLLDKSKMPKNKALVFSTYRHTLSYLEKQVRETELRYGVIHGNVPDEDRADLRHRFGLPKEDSQAIDVMLSSEVGCEGLDFQFCDLLINYDLPWNPMRIEQRIGRIDRYGQQSETVVIVNMITPGTVDADIYNRCLLRIGVFEQAIGGTEAILGDLAKEIGNIAESFELSEEDRKTRLKQLEDNTLRRIREDQELELKQSQLVGLTVPKESLNADVESADNPWLSPIAVQKLVSTFLVKRLKLEADPVLGEKTAKTLRLSKEARAELLRDLPKSSDPLVREWQKWLKGAEPTIGVTFEQEAATENPKVLYLSVGHPLVQQAASSFSMSSPAPVSLRVKTASVPAGRYPFSLYRWKKQGVRIDEDLVPVCLSHELSGSLLNLIALADDAPNETTVTASEREVLERDHHSRWTSAQANHIARNREQVEYKIQSLGASHASRCRVLEDQIAASTDPKILLMRRSELARAENSYVEQLNKLRTAAESGDIHVALLVHGCITIEGSR